MIDQLYKKKIIRDFLSLFSDNKWNQLISITLEYGILMLKSNYNLASLSIDDINNFVDEIKENQDKKELKNINNTRIIVTTKSDVKVSSENGSCLDEKATKPKSKWRKGDEVVFRKNTRSNSNAKDINNLKNSNITELDVSLKSEIYPKWWGEKKVKVSKRSSSKNKRIESVHDERKHNHKKLEISRNDLSQQEDSYSLYENRKIDKEKEKQKASNNKNKLVSSSVDKKFHKKKPNSSSNGPSNASHSRNNVEEPKIVMSFDMSDKNRFPFSKKNLAKKNESYNYQSENNSKNKVFSDHSEDRTPETRKHRLKKTESIESLKESKPIRAESRIKDHLQNDKKLFNLLKKSNYQTNNEVQVFCKDDKNFRDEDLNSAQDNYSMINNRMNKAQDNQRSNYLIEFDKNLDIRNVREKSQEKRHSLNNSETKQFFKPNLIPDEDNNQNNETYKRKYVNMNISNNNDYNNEDNDENLNSFYNNLSYEKSNLSILNKGKKTEKNMNNNNFAPLNDSISFINKLQNISAEINLKNNNDNVKSKPLTQKSTYINTPSFNKEHERIITMKNVNTLHNRSEYNDSDILSSYAPSERTKNLYLKGFNKDGFSDRTSYNNLSISESIENSRSMIKNREYGNHIQNNYNNAYSSVDDDYIHENQINLNDHLN